MLQQQLTGGACVLPHPSGRCWRRPGCAHVLTRCSPCARWADFCRPLASFMCSKTVLCTRCAALVARMDVRRRAPLLPRCAACARLAAPSAPPRRHMALHGAKATCFSLLHSSWNRGRRWEGAAAGSFHCAAGAAARCWGSLLLQQSLRACPATQPAALQPHHARAPLVPASLHPQVLQMQEDELVGVRWMVSGRYAGTQCWLALAACRSPSHTAASLPFDSHTSGCACTTHMPSVRAPPRPRPPYPTRPTPPSPPTPPHPPQPLEEYFAEPFTAARPLFKQIHAACRAYANGTYR